MEDEYPMIKVCIHDPKYRVHFVGPRMGTVISSLYGEFDGHYSDSWAEEYFKPAEKLVEKSHLDD